MTAAPTRIPTAVLESFKTTLHLLAEPDGVVEVRAPKTPSRGTVSGYYNDLAKCAQHVLTQLDGRVPGVYITLNPVKHDVAARAYNRLQAHALDTTKDAEITHRRWLPVDCDPVRPAGISSSDEEHADALERAEIVAEFLTEVMGWPAPLRADSGNGAHLLYRIDLPNDEDSRKLVEHVLKALASAYDGRGVKLDTSVGNAARIWKMYPTLAKKGDDVPERPHRRSRLLSVPDPIEVVTAEQLRELGEALLGDATTSDAAYKGTSSSADRQAGQSPRHIADAGDYLREHGIGVAVTKERGGSVTYVLDQCVWDAQHTDRSAWVTQFPSGSIAAGCQHNSCHGKGLAAFRDEVEGIGWRSPDKAPARPTSKASGIAVKAPAVERQDVPPEPTASPFDTVLSFPLDTLPPQVRAFVRTAAAAIYCPPDYVAMPLLGYAGAAIGNSACLEVKKGWRQFARFWIATVGDPGSGKSPGLDAARYVIDERQRKQHQEWEAACERWRQGGEDGDEPRLRQLYTVDTTIEALGDLLRDNHRSIVVARDEVSGWALAMNQYKQRGSDREQWLTLWSGGPLLVNRRARKRPLYVSHPFVSVVGGIQPDKLAELCDERGRNDGFIHRMLFVYPDHVRRQWTDADVADEAYHPIRTLFDALYDRTDGDVPLVVEFTPPARTLWREMMTELYDEMAQASFPDALRGPWAKLDMYIARLALTYHLMRAAFDTSVRSERCDDDSLAAAGDLADYLKSHIRRVYARLAARPEDVRLLRVVAWIREHGGSCTLRDLYDSGVGGITTKDEAEVEAEAITLRGWGRVDTISNPHGRATTRITLFDPAIRNMGGGEK